MQPVIIPYQRVSTISQAKDPEKGIARQKRRTYEAATKLSIEHGYRILDPVTDLAKSAFHKRNWEGDAGMGLIKAWIEDGDIARGSIVVFEDFDRMSRGQPMWVLSQMNHLLEAGLRIYTNHTETLFSYESMNNNMGELMMAVAFICNAYVDSKKKSDRTTESHQSQVSNAIEKNSVVTFGLLPAWIEIVDDKYHLIQDRVDLIKRMIDMCKNQNIGTQLIARTFNNEGVPIWDIRRETAKIWNSVRIHSVLTDKALIGQKTFKIKSGEYCIDDHYPALLSPEEFNVLQLRFQQRKDNNKINTTSSTVTNFVTGVGITECAYCGNAVVGKTIKRKTKTATVRDRIIVCRSGQDYGADHCSCARVLHRILERVVIEYCSDLVNFKPIFDQDGVRSELLERKDGIEIEINTLTKRRKKMMLAFMDEDDDDEQAQELITSLKSKIAVAKAKLTDVTSTLANTAESSIGDEFIELVEQVKSDDIPEDVRKKLRLLIPQFISKIVVAPYGLRFVREGDRAEKIQKTIDNGADDELIEFTKTMMETKDKGMLAFSLRFKSGHSRYIGVHKKYGTWEVIADTTGRFETPESKEIDAIFDSLLMENDNFSVSKVSAEIDPVEGNHTSKLDEFEQVSV